MKLFAIKGLRCAGLIALLAAAAPAGPLMRPARDVRIVYSMQPPGMKALIQQIQYWDINAQKLRIDLPGTPTTTLIDLRDQQVQLIRNDQRTVVTLQSHQVNPSNAGLKRGAQETVAGLVCTDWTAANGAAICLTDDGVILRAASQGVVLTQAVSVTYGEQPAALFTVPDGYRTIAPPRAR